MCECCGSSIAAVVLDVEGMICEHCINSVKKSVGELKGVKRVEVDLNKGQVEVEYSPNDTDVEHIKNAIIEAGYEVIDN